MLLLNIIYYIYNTVLTIIILNLMFFPFYNVSYLSQFRNTQYTRFIYKSTFFNQQISNSISPHFVWDGEEMLKTVKLYPFTYQ